VNHKHGSIGSDECAQSLRTSLSCKEPKHARSDHRTNFDFVNKESKRAAPEMHTKLCLGDSATAWGSLCSRYWSNKDGRKSELSNQLMKGHKCSNFKEVQQTITSVLNTKAQIAALGETVPDYLVKNVIESRLPSERESLLGALSGVDDVTADKLVAKVREWTAKDHVALRVDGRQQRFQHQRQPQHQQQERQ
jgi:hypothetical protein